MNARLDDIRISILPLFEDRSVGDVTFVDRDAYDVIPFGYTGNIDPLTCELLVVPVSPSRRDALMLTFVAIAFVVGVFEIIFHAETLLGSSHNQLPVVGQKLINRKVTDMVVTVAGAVIEPLSVWIVRVTAVADNQISITGIDDNGVKTKEAPVTRAADRSLNQSAVAGIEKAVDNFHLRDEPEGINRQIRKISIVVDREIASHTGSLRESYRGHG